MRKCLWLRVHLLFLSAFLTTLSFAQQDRKVTGSVTDDKNAPLLEATVSVKGSNQFTTTDVNGKFTITVSPNQKTLVITYVGMHPLEVSIGKSDVIAISLNPMTNAMTDVVVVGYGTSKRGDLTAAQVTVSSKDIDKSVNTTVEQ